MDSETYYSSILRLNHRDYWVEKSRINVNRLQIRERTIIFDDPKFIRTVITNAEVSRVSSTVDA